MIPTISFLQEIEKLAMSSILTSQGMVLATAMAVSGTVILLAFRLQKSTLHQFSLIVNNSSSAAVPPPPSGLKKKGKKKKRVHFAADVVDPTGNGDEYRRNYHRGAGESNANGNGNGKDNGSGSSTIDSGSKTRGMPANRAALYNGILRDRRVIHRTAYSSY